MLLIGNNRISFCMSLVSGSIDILHKVRYIVSIRDVSCLAM